VDKQIEYRNFKEITTRGIYGRGYPGLHAKYVVIDDAVALVSSANLATRAFHQTGENGVVVTAQPDVRRLATLFARLWAHSTFDLPPNRTESPVKHRDAGRAPRLPEVTGNGLLWTCAPETTVLSAMREVIDSARSDLVLATYSLLGIAHRLSADKPARPELLLDPVRAAVDRGVDVRLLLRGRNIGDVTRREAATFADAGVRIVPDRLNHAKGVITEAVRGALFSANFVPHMGLLGGVEVGMRLDDTPALAEASRYFAHAMAEADMDFVRDPTVAELATGMSAESLTTWPHPAPLDVTTRPADWSALAASTDFALYEAESAQRLTIHCARRRWQLVRKNDRWSARPPLGSVRCASSSPSSPATSITTSRCWLRISRPRPSTARSSTRCGTPDARPTPSAGHNVGWGSAIRSTKASFVTSMWTCCLSVVPPTKRSLCGGNCSIGTRPGPITTICAAPPNAPATGPACATRRSGGCATPPPDSPPTPTTSSAYSSTRANWTKPGRQRLTTPRTCLSHAGISSSSCANPPIRGT
jgi:hypothetical protein